MLISDITNETMIIEKKRTHKILSPEIKKQKLISFFNSVYHNPQYKMQFQIIENALQLSEHQILTEFLNYNMDIFQPIGNTIYSSLANRVVLHIHNLLEGSWHIERQKIISNIVTFTKVKKIADIGFGVPSLYMKNILETNINFSLHLCDLYQSAFDFAKILINTWHSQWKKFITFTKTDMDKIEYMGDFDMYIFQDSIEHAQQPTEYLKHLVEKSPCHSQFLFSLPIGPIFPRHTIAWETHIEAQEWLAQCGLAIVFEKNVYVNPNVDLFAEQLTPDYCNYITLCKKTD